MEILIILNMFTLTLKYEYFLIISYEITITCLICDGNTHILNFQTILHVVTVPVISSICSENILNFKY